MSLLQVEEPPPISETQTSEVEPLVQNEEEEEAAAKREQDEKAISFYNALKIPVSKLIS